MVEMGRRVSRSSLLAASLVQTQGDLNGVVQAFVHMVAPPCESAIV